MTAPQADAGYSARTVAEMTGVTYRQLDYWARTDLVRPSLADAHGSGTRRRYSTADLLQLRTIASLLDAGVSLTRIRALLGEIEERHLDLATVEFVIRDGRIVPLEWAPS